VVYPLTRRLHHLVYVQERAAPSCNRSPGIFRRGTWGLYSPVSGLGRGANAGTATEAVSDHQVERHVELFVLRFSILVCFLRGLLTNLYTRSLYYCHRRNYFGPVIK
jgi:hypothetical protein